MSHIHLYVLLFSQSCFTKNRHFFVSCVKKDKFWYKKALHENIFLSFFCTAHKKCRSFAQFGVRVQNVIMYERNVCSEFLLTF
jgi:hypothetical protein